MIAQTTSWWRPTASLSRVLVWMLAAQGVLTLSWLSLDAERWLQLFDRALDAAIDSRSSEFERLMNRMSEQGNSFTQLAGIASLTTFILVVVWTWRSVSNLRVLDRTGARLSPGWTIAMWFIPVANLVLPYLVFQDLWRSSDPQSEAGDGWKRGHGSPLVAAAWSLYVVGACAPIVALTVVGTTDTSASDMAWLLLLGYVATSAACLLAIPSVRRITARQEALQATAATHGPLPGMATGNAPGWHPDPHAEHLARYWDGQAWTEHVATAAGVTTAPVLPPEWHPDPTGRFEWRFWDGYGWTEHVSRNGELTTDPL